MRRPRRPLGGWTALHVTWITTRSNRAHGYQGEGGSMVFTSSIGGLKRIQHVVHHVSAEHGILGDAFTKGTGAPAGSRGR